jgi:hypothetical protein
VLDLCYYGGFCPGGHFCCGLLLQVCVPGVKVCPLPGPAELPGQDVPITSPLWLVQVGGVVSPGVILADALPINDGAAATDANPMATIANSPNFVFVCIKLQKIF